MSNRFICVIIGLAFLSVLELMATSSADESKASLAELLNLYKELGLPLPGKEAKLVRYEATGGTPKHFSLAFELKPATKTGPPTLLTGIYDQPVHWQTEITEVRPNKDAAKESDDDLWGLLLAVQCHYRGWDELAKVLFENSQKGVKSTPHEQLYSHAWSYWHQLLTTPKSDWVEIAKRLRDLMSRDKNLDTTTNQALLKSLDLALVPSHAKPGSIEALIDRLVDYTGGGVGEEAKSELHYTRIAKLGFEAVPALIEHLDDQRLTRGTMEGFNNFRSFNLRVQHVVSDLLQELAGAEIKFDWLRRQLGYTVDRHEVLGWWFRAKMEGEETFLLKHYVDANQEADGGRGWKIRQHRLSIIQAKYAKRIPGLYHKVLDNYPDIESDSLARAILAIELPKKEKIKLYLHAIENEDPRHQIPALYALSKLDSKVFKYNPQVTPREWTQIRNRVREALDREVKEAERKP